MLSNFDYLLIVFNFFITNRLIKFQYKMYTSARMQTLTTLILVIPLLITNIQTDLLLTSFGIAVRIDVDSSKIDLKKGNFCGDLNG